MDAPLKETPEVRLERRLSAIEGQIHTLGLTVRGYHAQVKDELGRHRAEIYGSAQAPGLRTQLDRLEQVESRRVWHVRALWAAALAGLARWVTLWER